jgi:hypothetical protein
MIRLTLRSLRTLRTMTENQFYSLWEKFAESNIITQLPDDVEKFCEDHEITVDYYIEEFM